MEVNTGRVLVLASSPSCDLERFASGLSAVEWAALTRSPLNPLLNRATRGVYSPGSTFKVITALAALYQGIITPSTTVECNGAIRFGDRVFRCWKHSGHGKVDLEKALSQSCDVYFYKIAEKLDIDVLADFARIFGLGRATGIGIDEAAGLVGDRGWKRRTGRGPWLPGETLNMAIGQGFNNSTPLQICRLYAAIANGGIVYRPTLVERVVDPDGKTIREFAPHPDGRFDDHAGYLPIIRKALVEAVNGTHGTGRKAALEGITVAGKTGTSQVVRSQRYEGMRMKDIPRKERDHAWFACFAPAQRPEIAVAVLVENGGHGGSAAAPIAKKVLEQYFAGRRTAAD
jgi:penicillin-binding protein 2